MLKTSDTPFHGRRQGMSEKDHVALCNAQAPGSSGDVAVLLVFAVEGKCPVADARSPICAQSA